MRCSRRSLKFLGIIGENDVLDAKTLPKVEMPNRDGLVPAVLVYPPEKKPSWY
jgi:hypothetical protein